MSSISTCSEETGKHNLRRPRDIVFDEAYMRDDDIVDEDYGQDSGQKIRKLVELVICPGLFKRGNADGGRYDTEPCILQQPVLCRDS